MKSINNAETSLHKDIDSSLPQQNKHDYGKSCFQIAQNLASQLKLDQALMYCGLAIEQDPQNANYSEFYYQLSQLRSRSYQPALNFAIADFSYRLWSEQNTPTLADLRRLCEQLPAIANKPLISIIISGNIPKPQQLKKTIQSLQDQVYPHWELLIPISASHPQEQDNQTNNHKRSLLQDLIQGDQRIKNIPHTSPDQKTEFFSTDFATTKGQWIAIIQAETLLTPIALSEFVRQLQQNPTLDIAYGDEDYLNKNNCREKPCFKPQWSPELFLARNYFNSLSFIRKTLVSNIAVDFNSNLTRNNSYNYHYDLLLRLTEKTNNIAHISHILTHVQHQPEQINNNQLISNTLKRRGEFGIVTNHPNFPHLQTIRYPLNHHPLISIIIPTKNLGTMLDSCLTSIFTFSTYANYEVIIIDNSSDQPDALAAIAKWQQAKPEQVRVFNYNQPFNYSAINNFGVHQAQGDYLLFLNNDTKVITPDWLEGMVEQAQREKVGAVGAMLLYADNTIQHAGIIMGVKGIAGHSHRHYSLGEEGYYQYLLTNQNVAAVTGACLMCHRDIFEEVGGFNEQLAIAYNDVDFCLKIHQQGYQNLWLPHVQLYHYESQTRTPENTPAKQRRIQQEVDYMEKNWGHLIKQDPFYNCHLTRDKEDFSLEVTYHFRIKSILLPTSKPEKLTGYFLDRPQVDYQANKHLEIVGWAISKVAPALSLEISCQNHLLTTIPVCQTRPDVAEAFSQIKTAIHSGFATTIDLNQIEDKLIHTSLVSNLELVLTVVLANQDRIKIATIQLTF